MQPGTTLKHYRIVRKLGSGATGEVYLAFDTVLSRSVALKVLHSEPDAGPERTRRFIEEARAASALNHPNIATIHELQEAGGVHFIVMEYVEGTTLKAQIANGALDSDEIVKLATQIAEALDAAHRVGIIHRDIKSSNIMVTPRGYAKVLDFGLAKRLTGDSSAGDQTTTMATQQGVVMGTVPYMSPEQALGKPLDRRSDLFSLGVVLYEMSTGRLPFSGSTQFETIDNIIHSAPAPITSINPNISPGLERVILRCLAKRLEDRVQAAADLVTDFRQSEKDGLVSGREAESRSNLPQQLTQFIGRRREISEIRDLLTHTRLLTLSGPGGIGKTRLALQVAADLLPGFSDGVWFVELASLRDEDLVPHTVASVLGVHQETGRSMGDSVVNRVKGRRFLLVLDNCEHLIGACARFTDLLLRNSENLRVLATSREPLSIAGEMVFRVASLSIPDPGRLSDPANLGQYEAVSLFMDRARAARPTFALTNSVAVPLATVCVQLDGIPLAIELAASRISALSVEQIAARLNDRLTLLTGHSRTALPRHQTLLATLDWSYNLLSESERVLFRRLSVFSGGWSLEAAETVCAGNGILKEDLLELLSALVDKSLVIAEERDGEQRYRFMVTVLEYAHKRLLQTDGEDAICRAHAEYFAALAAEAEPKLMSTAAQKVWLERLSAENDNLRAVLNWAARNAAETGLSLAGALGTFWYLRGYWDEGRRWLAEMLAASGVLAHTTHAVKAINAAARISLNQGEYQAARSLSDEALILSRASGDKREAGVALNCLAVIAGHHGDFALAASLLEECLSVRRDVGDKGVIAATLLNIGIVSFRQCEFDLARSRYEECLAISRAIGFKHGIGTALVNLSVVFRRLGDYATAQSLIEEGVAVAKELGDAAVTPVALSSLGELAARRGERSASIAFQAEALQICRELGDKRVMAEVLLSLGVVADEYQRARALFEECLAIRRQLGANAEIAIVLNCLGGVTARHGDCVAARALHEEAFAICQQRGARDGIAQSLGGLADVARLSGDSALALSMYKQSLRIWWELGEKPKFMQPIEHMAALAMSRGEVDRAVCMWGAAQCLRDAIGHPHRPYEADECERHIAAGRAAVGEERFVAAWQRGNAMRTDEVIGFALQEDGS